MKLEARISLEYDDEKVAEAIVKAVSPDNVEYGEMLSVKTFKKGNMVISLVFCKEKIGTFISTIDDLLRCISVAEKTFKVIKE